MKKKRMRDGVRTDKTISPKMQERSKRQSFGVVAEERELFGFKMTSITVISPEASHVHECLKDTDTTLCKPYTMFYSSVWPS